MSYLKPCTTLVVNQHSTALIPHPKYLKYFQSPSRILSFTYHPDIVKKIVGDSILRYINYLERQISARSIIGCKPSKKTLTALDKFEFAYLTAFGGVNVEKQSRLVENAAKCLSNLYVDEDIGKSMANRIIENHQDGLYALPNPKPGKPAHFQSLAKLSTPAILSNHLKALYYYYMQNKNTHVNPKMFNQLLLRDVRDICQDKHLDFTYSINAHPKNAWFELPLPSDRDIDKIWEDKFQVLQLSRFGIKKVKINHKANAGYLKLDMFVSKNLPEARDAIHKALKILGNTKVLIIDLRDNSGGDPNMVAYLAGYFFDKKTLINRKFERYSQKTSTLYAHPPKNPDRAYFGPDKPVYILTSKRTFSSAEAFADTMRMHHRATIIGENTAGGAHIVRSYHLDENFSLMVPVIRTINPQTQKNWEGTGIMPDIHLLPGEDPLKAALSDFAFRQAMNLEMRARQLNI